jgi:hypothetical protein
MGYVTYSHPRRTNRNPVQRARTEESSSPFSMQMPQGETRRIQLTFNLCPGDALTLTAALETVAQLAPGKYQFKVSGTCLEVFENNPHCVEFHNPDLVFEPHYPQIHETGRACVQYISGYAEDVCKQLGVTFHPCVKRPYIYFSEKELAKPRQIQGRYCVLNAGIKTDYEIKWE